MEMEDSDGLEATMLGDGVAQKDDAIEDGSNAMREPRNAPEVMGGGVEAAVAEMKAASKGGGDGVTEEELVKV